MACKISEKTRITAKKIVSYDVTGHDILFFRRGGKMRFCLMITTERSLHSSRLVTVSLFILLFGLQAYGLAQSDPKRLLVKVNGHSITQGDLDFFFLSRGGSGGGSTAETIDDVIADKVFREGKHFTDKSSGQIKEIIKKTKKVYDDYLNVGGTRQIWRRGDIILIEDGVGSGTIYTADSVRIAIQRVIQFAK